MSEEHIPIPEGWLDPQFRGGAGPEFDPVATAQPVLMPPGGPGFGPGMKPAGVAGMVRAGEMALPIPAPTTTPGGLIGVGSSGGSTTYRKPSGSSPDGPVIHASDAWMMTLNTGVGGQGLMAGQEWNPEDEFESSEVEPPGPVIDPLFPEPPVVQPPPEILFPEFPKPFEDYPNTPLAGSGHPSPPWRPPNLPPGSWGEGPRWGGPWWVFPPFTHVSPEPERAVDPEEETETPNREARYLRILDRLIEEARADWSWWTNRFADHLVAWQWVRDNPDPDPDVQAAKLAQAHARVKMAGYNVNRLAAKTFRLEAKIERVQEQARRRTERRHR